MSHGTVARAEALLAAGRPHQAIEILSQALASRPDDTELLHVLVRAQLQVDPRQALTTAKTLVGLEPDNAYSHRWCAIAHGRLGQRDEAVRHARTASTLAPSDPYVLSTLATTRSRTKGGHKEALATAKRAIVLAPEHPIGYHAAGVVELNEAHWRRAARWFERALEIDPHHEAAQKDLAVAKEEAGDLAAALGGVGALLRFDPTDDEAREALDGVVHTTLVHILWTALVLLFVVGALRGAVAP